MRISDWSSDVCSSDLQRGKQGAEFHRQVVVLFRLAAGAQQARPAVDVPADDEDAVPRLQKGAPHGEEVVGGVDQHAGAAAAGDAPAGIVLLEDLRSVLDRKSKRLNSSH